MSSLELDDIQSGVQATSAFLFSDVDPDTGSGEASNAMWQPSRDPSASSVGMMRGPDWRRVIDEPNALKTDAT